MKAQTALTWIHWLGALAVAGLAPALAQDLRNCGGISKNRELFATRPWLHVASATAEIRDQWGHWRVTIQAEPDAANLLLFMPNSCDEEPLFYSHERDERGLPKKLYTIRITDIDQEYTVEIKSNAIYLDLKDQVERVHFIRVVRTWAYQGPPGRFTVVTPDAAEKARMGPLPTFDAWFEVSKNQTSVGIGPSHLGTYGTGVVSAIEYFHPPAPLPRPVQ